MPKRKRFRNFLASTIAVVVLVLAPSLWGLTRAMIACKGSGNQEINSSGLFPGETKDIIDYRRPEDLTYLTFPEWYIVYNTEEYAGFISDHSPSKFPYFKAVAQYWDSYVFSCKLVRDKYQFNSTYHPTLGFIGLSFSAENVLKALYEYTVGNITGWLGSAQTEEEQYASKVAKEYGEFLHTTPWYFFPFSQKLAILWTEIDIIGKNPIRKIERRLMLTSEYGGKYLYSGFTKLLSKITYGGEDSSKIYAVTEGSLGASTNADFEVVRPLDDGNTNLVRLTRFETFNKTVLDNIQSDFDFIEIAGNDEIMVTLISPKDNEHTYQSGEYLYDLPILTNNNLTRVAVSLKLVNLKDFIKEVKLKGETLEHIYDY
jgi:hypothetical protein